ncbi:alpha/beta hydrolase [Paenibacillus dendritiformis]|uniref:alpha/beta hydrolase family protein n=1 Tax=Paenibacillus dendritiformis TaxID=130049 RepID=UPI00143CD4F2|nr:alpha/beta hydrolase [Paenibacillus dendritiformis]NKI19876.1 alpha/beta hydrolase [Paenibacillus dendritiformis]NRG01264.1 alpha/beta hydrolase [Paenibacillus dendritiformis]
MGILLLVIAAVFEAAFAVYCIWTKSNQNKVRSVMRIGAFAVFVMFTLASVIEWSFRWVGIGLLLLVWAVLGMRTLIRSKEERQPYRCGRIVRNAVVMLVLVAMAASPALVFPQYALPQVTGKYEVASVSYTYIDKNRMEQFTGTGENRAVNVGFWYPANADGTYPLLVFSHGAYGINESNASTYTELASHGYVVCSIDHPYHSFYTASVDGTVVLVNSAYMQEVNNANKGKYTIEENYGLIQKWMKLRTDDMNFVIDTILEKAKTGSENVYRLVNTEKIGVFGHSMGGAASVWLGRERDDIGAVVNIDAPLFSELVYNRETDDLAASGQPYTTPLLNMYSDSVWVQLNSNSTYAANKAIDELGTEVYTVYFQGAKHMSLTDLALFSPMLANMLQGGRAEIDAYYCIETMNRIILEFFDCYLKGKGSFTSAGTY